MKVVVASPEQDCAAHRALRAEGVPHEIALCTDDLDYGQLMEVLGMTQFTPFGGGQEPLDRPWNDPDLWKKG